MKAPFKSGLALALLLSPVASFALKVPVPIDGVTLNINLQLQTQLLANENGNAAGSRWSADVFVRRTRLLVNGDIGKHLSYLVQLDNANFDKYGNTSGRT